MLLRKMPARKWRIFCFLLPLFFCVELRADIWPAVLVGQPAPGIAGARFISLGTPAVNASGDIAFRAGVAVGQVQSDGNTIFKISGGQLALAVSIDQPVPDSPGATFAQFGDPDMNNLGDMAFLALMHGRTAGFEGIFVKSGEALRKVVDFDTPVPGAPGQTFQEFDSVRINDAGDVIIAASPLPGSGSPGPTGTYLASNGTLRLITQNAGVSNNRGDVVFSSADGLFLFSNGSLTRIAAHGQPISNSTLLVDGPQYASINDDDDIAFVNVLSPDGRNPVRGAVVRWHAGVLEKIAAGGDPVPGITGSRLDPQFLPPEINQSGILFDTRMQIPGVDGNPAVIGRFQDGQWSVLARGDQLVEGIGLLGDMCCPNFDKQQGPLVAFVSNYNLNTVVALYTATAGQFHLLFPHMADGTASGGGWRTTFILANRSTAAASTTVNFYDDNGSPMNVGIGGHQQTQFSITVPALGVAQFQTDGVGALQAGWANVQSDQNVSGIALFGFFDGSGKFINEVGAPATVPLRSMSVFVQAGTSTSTGVALANPNGTAASVTLILRDSNSNELGRTSVTIPVMGHIAKYVGELFPSIALGQFEGKLEVISTQSLVALTLRQRETVFTSLPVIP